MTDLIRIDLLERKASLEGATRCEGRSATLMRQCGWRLHLLLCGNTFIGAALKAEVGADGATEVDANLVTTLSKYEVARHISQVFCLECLAASNLHTARCLLSALVQVLPQLLHEYRAAPKSESNAIT